MIQREANAYNRLADEFTEEYAALREHKDLLARWAATEKNGTVSTGEAVEKDRGRGTFGRSSGNTIPPGKGCLPLSPA